MTTATTAPAGTGLAHAQLPPPATMEERQKLMAELQKIASEPEAKWLREELRHVDGYETPSYDLENRLLLTANGIRIERAYDGRSLGYYRKPVWNLLGFRCTADEEAARIRQVVHNLCCQSDRPVHEAHHGRATEAIALARSTVKNWLRNRGIRL